MGQDYKVISVSSQDPQHPVSNISSFNDAASVWQTSTQQEKQASFVVEFPHPAKIENISLVNAGSQSVELQISESSNAEDFAVLLPDTVIMANGQTQTIVRLEQSNFSNNLGDKEFLRLRVVCTAPTVDNQLYGLSFFGVNLSDDEFKQLQTTYLPQQQQQPQQEQPQPQQQAQQQVQVPAAVATSHPLPPAPAPAPVAVTAAPTTPTTVTVKPAPAPSSQEKQTKRKIVYVDDEDEDEDDDDGEVEEEDEWQEEGQSEDEYSEGGSDDDEDSDDGSRRRRSTRAKPTKVVTRSRTTPTRAAASKRRR